MSYTVLARRYRSTSFNELVGQEPIAKTLVNAIATGRVAHAYLFTGTRGVGKTSMARIFARGLNAPDTIDGCPKPDDAEYPEIDIQQRMAEAIMRGDDLNVIEIDGASNRGVNEARQLIANAGLAPTGNARYKIYIIDEVHMLTPEAFNALLKIMEEPPAHVKFILCTTESHKVPPTITSRCQRFDFRNISTSRITEHLTQVLGNENVKADTEVVYQVARLGNGSMRDALSLLDRLIATGEQPLTLEVLEQMFGLPPRERVVALVESLAGGDITETLNQTAALLESGIGQDQLIEVLIERLRQLMLINACGADSDLVELSDDARTEAVEQAGSFDTPALVHMIALCENLQRNSRVSSNPRAMLDATVVRLALAEKMADVTAVLSGSAPAASAPPKKKVTPVVKTTAPVVQPVTSQDEPANETAQQIPGTVANPDDADQVWTALLDSVAGKNAWTWLRSVNLNRIEKNVAHVSIEPGHSDIRKFAEHRIESLSKLIRPIVGRPVQVKIEDEMAINEAPGKDDDDNPMDLPLVQQVMDVFRDAKIISSRKEETESNDV